MVRIYIHYKIGSQCHFFFLFENLQQLFPLFVSLWVSIVLKYKDAIWSLIKVLFLQEWPLRWEQPNYAFACECSSEIWKWRKFGSWAGLGSEWIQELTGMGVIGGNGLTMGLIDLDSSVTILYRCLLPIDIANLWKAVNRIKIMIGEFSPKIFWPFFWPPRSHFCANFGVIGVTLCP